MSVPNSGCTPTRIISFHQASDIEVNVDDTLFSLHVNPYFLRLNFSYPLLEDEQSSAKYDPGPGFVTVTLTKETRGQEFKDLDLMAKLLAPRPSKTTPLIEVLDDDLAASMDKVSIDDGLLEGGCFTVTFLTSSHLPPLAGAKNDWQLPQEVPEPLSTASLRTESVSRYGFLDRHFGYFEHVSYTENEVNELGPDAETLDPTERRARRVKHEDDKWDEEYYLYV